MRRLLFLLLLLAGSGLALSGCVVATTDHPGYYRSGYAYRNYGPPPGRLDEAPPYRYRRPYW